MGVGKERDKMVVEDKDTSDSLAQSNSCVETIIVRKDNGTIKVAPFPDENAGSLNRMNAISEDHAWIQYQLARFRDKTRG